MAFLQTFFSEFARVDWMGVLVAAKWIFLALDVATLFGIVYFWDKGLAMKPDLHRPAAGKPKITAERTVNVRDAWGKIVARAAEGGSPETLTLAIIEADKLLDDVLRALGYQGEHLAERLDQLERRRKTQATQRLWQAHRIRNNLVHASGFNISPVQAKEVLAVYEGFFREIKAI